MSTDKLNASAFRGQRGQVLVVVALSFTVLMLFVALAVDIGFWYGERRHMQNAADAGALAGAYELCPGGDPSQYEEAAISYAQRNGATTVQVLRVDADGTPNPSSGTTVVVHALTEAPTFFSRLVLPNAITVDAVAAAACGGAESGCGALPIAFDEPTYTHDIPCSEFVSTPSPGYPHGHFTNYRIGSTFVVWAGDNEVYRSEDLCTKCICNGPTGRSDSTDRLYDYITDRFTSKTLVNGVEWGDIALEDSPEFFLGGDPMGPGNRGWLRLGVDDAPLGEEAANDKGLCVEGNGTIKKDCGNILNCWIKYGFPGTITEGMCLGTLPGIGDGIATAKDNIQNQIRSFVLYDPEPVVSCTDTDFDCNSGDGGTILRVSGFGCGLVLHVFAKKSDDGIAMDNNPSYPCGSLCKPVGDPEYDANCPSTCPDCPGQLKKDGSYNQGELGIMVTRVCDCEDATGCGTSGQPTGEGQPSATSLVTVPSVTWPSLP